MSRIVLDTDVASSVFKGDVDGPDVRRHVRHSECCLTFVAVGELWQWTVGHRWSPRAKVRLERWIETMPVIESDASISRLWGGLSGHARRRGRPRPQNDTWIAACCLERDLPLLTRNMRDFTDYAEHEGLRLLTS